MAATADPSDGEEQLADSATEDSSEESDPDPFEQEVQRYLDEGMSVPAIAGEVAGYNGYHSLPETIAAINQIKYNDTDDQ